MTSHLATLDRTKQFCSVATSFEEPKDFKELKCTYSRQSGFSKSINVSCEFNIT